MIFTRIEPELRTPTNAHECTSDAPPRSNPCAGGQLAEGQERKAKKLLFQSFNFPRENGALATTVDFLEYQRGC